MLTQEQIDKLEVGDMVKLRDMIFPFVHMRKLTYDGSVVAIVVDAGCGELHSWPPEKCELAEE